MRLFIGRIETSHFSPFFRGKNDKTCAKTSNYEWDNSLGLLGAHGPIVFFAAAAAAIGNREIGAAAAFFGKWAHNSYPLGKIRRMK
jgi:hypothetical protein